MKVFFSFVFLSIIFLSVRLGAQTPGLYDTWTCSYPYYIPAIKITPDTIEIIEEAIYKPNPKTILPSAEDLRKDSAGKTGFPRIKKIILLKVIYDSAQAKGRIFFQRGKYSGIAYLRFLIKDNGEASFGSGKAERNGAYKRG